MRYIRFLKAPKTDGKNVTALVTITSDLGESFLVEDVDLTAALVADEGGIILVEKNFSWRAGMRALPISVDCYHIRKSTSSVRVHVGLKHRPKSDHFAEHHRQAQLPCVISAWSDSINYSKGILQAQKVIERRFTKLTGEPLRIWEETGESIARHVWDAGVALSAFIDRVVMKQSKTTELTLLQNILSPSRPRSLNVLELGSGCGIVGITLASMIPDSHVLLTDLADAMSICQKNIQVARPALSSTINFEILDWDLPLPVSVTSKTFDLVLIADCTYNPDSSPALVRTLRSLQQRSPNMVILVAMKIRHASEAVFFDLMHGEDFVRREKLTLPVATEDSAVEEEVELHVFKTRSSS